MNDCRVLFVRSSLGVGEGRIFLFPEALAGQFDAIGVVDEAIEDGVCRALTPSWASRNVCRICRIVSSLFAGIQSSPWWLTRGKMPELLTQPKTLESPGRWPE